MFIISPALPPHVVRDDVCAARARCTSLRNADSHFSSLLQLVVAFPLFLSTFSGCDKFRTPPMLAPPEAAITPHATPANDPSDNSQSESGGSESLAKLKANERIEKTLESPSMLNVHKATLIDVVELISRLHGVQFEIDPAYRDSEVSINFEGVLRDELTAILDPLSLKWKIRDGKVIITSGLER